MVDFDSEQRTWFVMSNSIATGGRSESQQSTAVHQSVTPILEPMIRNRTLALAQRQHFDALICQFAGERRYNTHTRPSGIHPRRLPLNSDRSALLRSALHHMMASAPDRSASVSQPCPQSPASISAMSPKAFASPAAGPVAPPSCTGVNNTNTYIKSDLSVTHKCVLECNHTLVCKIAPPTVARAFGNCQTQKSGHWEA